MLKMIPITAGPITTEGIEIPIKYGRTLDKLFFSESGSIKKFFIYITYFHILKIFLFNYRNLRKSRFYYMHSFCNAKRNSLIFYF